MGKNIKKYNKFINSCLKIINKIIFFTGLRPQTYHFFKSGRLATWRSLIRFHFLSLARFYICLLDSNTSSASWVWCLPNLSPSLPSLSLRVFLSESESSKYFIRFQSDEMQHWDDSIYILTLYYKFRS